MSDLAVTSQPKMAAALAAAAPALFRTAAELRSAAQPRSRPRLRRTSTLVTYLEDLAGRKLAADEIAVASEAYRDALRGSGDQ